MLGYILSFLAGGFFVCSVLFVIAAKRIIRKNKGKIAGSNSKEPVHETVVAVLNSTEGGKRVIE